MTGIQEIFTGGAGAGRNSGTALEIATTLACVADATNYIDRQTAVYRSKFFKLILSEHQACFFIFRHRKIMLTKWLCGEKLNRRKFKQKNSLEEMASKLVNNRRNFNRRLIKATGNTPVEYSHFAKVEVAKRILKKKKRHFWSND